MFSRLDAECPPETSVTSNITADTTWGTCGSPYIIGANVTVVSGVTLTIDPGVVVKFSGNYKLQVIGTLIADGVIFTSGKATPAKSDWLRIEFSGGSNSSVRNSIIEYANYGIYCSSSSPVITGNTIRNNTFGIGLSDSSAPLIEYNNFLNNDSAIYGSAGSTGGINPVISNNTFFILET